MGEKFWSWYLANQDNVGPLLAPLASLMTGMLTVIIASFGAWIALDQAKTNRSRHEEQTKADIQRRITESFTKAVEQLGSDNPQVRLGGVYTLERIARESKFDYRPVMETLTAFVREQALWKQKDTLATEKTARIYEDNAPQPSTPRPPADIAAALGVIMRLVAQNREREVAESWQADKGEDNDWTFDLSYTDLRGADLWGAHLDGANLRVRPVDHEHLPKRRTRSMTEAA
jgi:hypothetical protein